MRREEVGGLKVVSYLRTSHAKVVEQLGLSIVGGRFGIGEPLPGDTELEAEYGVSRSVLREAMKTLAAKGLVIAKSRVGTRVTDRCHWNLIDEDVLRWHFRTGVTREFIDHLYDVRLVLEPAAAGFAAMRATAEDCEQLRGYANLLGSNDLDWPSQVEADLRFHVLLTIVGGNPFLESMIGFIKASLDGAFTWRSTRSWPVAAKPSPSSTSQSSRQSKIATRMAHVAPRKRRSTSDAQPP